MMGLYEDIIKESAQRNLEALNEEVRQATEEGSEETNE